MNRKSKLIISVVALLCVISILFVACSNKENETKKQYSETFEGVVSELYYEDADSAVKAFLDNEIDSDFNKATFRMYIKDSELSPDSIALLNLQEEGTIQSVEKGIVIYLVESEVVATEIRGESATVYIVEIKPKNSNNIEYKYIAPLPEKGEPLSKSYYNSVYDSNKYKNSTSKMSVSSVVKIGDSIINTKVDSTCYIADDSVYMTTTTTSLGQPTKADMYLWNDADEVFGAMVSNNQVNYLSTAEIKTKYGLESLEEFFSQGITEFDFSYYKKTETGFALNDAVIVKLIDMALNTTGLKMNNPTAICNFYVSDGHIDSMVMSYSGSTLINNDEISLSFEVSVDFTDFGKTKVTIPAEYKQHFENK